MQWKCGRKHLQVFFVHEASLCCCGAEFGLKAKGLKLETKEKKFSDTTHVLLTCVGLVPLNKVNLDPLIMTVLRTVKLPGFGVSPESCLTETREIS